mgnify:FL=1
MIDWHEGIGPTQWRSKDGRIKELSEMATPYLLNCLDLAKRNPVHHSRLAAIDRELKSRGFGQFCYRCWMVVRLPKGMQVEYYLFGIADDIEVISVGCSTPCVVLP